MKSIIGLFVTKLKILWHKGAFHILIGNFLTKFVAFFGSIFLVRVLSKESYGILTYVENIYGYIYILSGMGLANSVLRFIVLARDKHKENAYYRYAISKGSLFNIFLVMIIVVVAYFYQYPTEFLKARWLIIAMSVSLLFQFIIDVNIFTFRSKFDNTRYAIAAFLSSTFLIIGKFFGALTWDVNGVVLSIIFINVCLAALFQFYIKKTYFTEINLIEIERAEKKKINLYSIQYMITNGIWTLFMLNDIFLLGLLNGNPTTIAEYKVAYVLPGNLAIFSGAIGIFVAPYFVKHEGDFAWIRKNYLKVFTITASIIAAAVIFLMIFSEEIIIFLYGENYLNIVPIMRLLLIAAFINSGLRFTTANLFAAMGQIKYNMFISFVGVVMQVIINFRAIPLFGVKGIAYTSIVIYSVMATVLFVMFAIKYKIFSENK